jgi:hypothetical protein
MLKDIEKVIRDYLPEVIHMSLATCKDNKPWVCEVHFVYDNDLNLYFVSLPSTRHSSELRANPYVSGNIVKQFKLGEKPAASISKVRQKNCIMLISSIPLLLLTTNDTTLENWMVINFIGFWLIHSMFLIESSRKGKNMS